MQKYTVEKTVGEGSFGKALLARRNADRRLVIIKQISISKMPAKEMARTELEATLLSRLNHPNIVSFIESFKTSSNLHIVMEYADGGDLETHIKNRRGKLLVENEVLHMFVQIALAIKHIHDRKILHRDLKSQNIFLTRSGMVKLGDFGVSRVLERTVDFAATQVGTPYYMPPEICNGSKYNSKCDIWSLGIVMYELMTLGMPFKGSSMQQLLRNIVSQPFPSVSSSRYCQELRLLLENMLCKNHTKRPGINMILRSPVILNRIANYLDDNVKRQEFSHTVLHGAHILRGKPPFTPGAAGVGAPSPSAHAHAAAPAAAPKGDSPYVNPLVNPRVGASPAAAVAPTPSPSAAAAAAMHERDRQLREREDARKLQRAAEERRERARERDRQQAVAAAAAREREREREKEREREIERIRDKLAAEKRAVEQSRQRELDKDRARAAAEREKERVRAADAARERAIKEKAAEAERQLKARRERDAKDQAERDQEEKAKLLRAKLKAASPPPVLSPSPSAAGIVGASKPTPPLPPKSANKAEAKEVGLVRGLKCHDDDTDSSEERDLRRLGPPPKNPVPSAAKPLALQKPVGLAALEGLGMGDEWLSELEQRMCHLKVQVKQMQANSPKGPSSHTPQRAKVAPGKAAAAPSPSVAAGARPQSAGPEVGRKAATPSQQQQKPRVLIAAPKAAAAAVNNKPAAVGKPSAYDLAREQELEAKEREERRREREELREKHRLGLKAFVQAKRDAKGQEDDLPDTPPADLDLAFVSDDVVVPSVFKFVVAQAPPSRPGSAKKASVATPRPLSANKKSPPSNVKGVGSTPTPTSSVKLAPPQRSVSKEEREKSRESLKIAMQAARKNGLAAKGGGDIGIEIYTPSRDPPPLQQLQQPARSPPRSPPRTASSSTSPSSPRTAGRRAARPVDLYSTREIEIANQAELDARVYKLEADKREHSIHDLDIEDTDDDDSVEHDLSGIAELCDQFDFDAQNLTSSAKGKKSPSVLAQFNTTLKHIFSSSNGATLLNDTNNSKNAAPSPPLEEAESPIGSASVDYHAMIRIMEQVMRNTSKVLPSSAAAAGDSATSEIETALGIGSSDPDLVIYDDEDDDTFGEDEEAYILLGTPDKERPTKKSDISPILRGTTTSMISDELRATMPNDNDDDDDAPPTYEEAARLGEALGAEMDEVEEEEGEGVFPYDVKDLGVGLTTITKLPDPEHAAYLTEFLTEMFGQEKLGEALSLLRNSLSTSPAKKVGSHDADEEDMLLSNLEQILGTQGLGHIDDLFFLVQAV